MGISTVLSVLIAYYNRDCAAELKILIWWLVCLGRADGAFNHVLCHWTSSRIQIFISLAVICQVTK
jgi:hypothetical protein